MNCLKCDGDTRVMDSNTMPSEVYRMRCCKSCGFRFPTREVAYEGAYVHRPKRGKSKPKAAKPASPRKPRVAKRKPTPEKSVQAKVHDIEDSLPEAEDPVDKEKALAAKRLRDFLNRKYEVVGDDYGY